MPGIKHTISTLANVSNRLIWIAEDKCWLMVMNFKDTQQCYDGGKSLPCNWRLRSHADLKIEIERDSIKGDEHLLPDWLPWQWDLIDKLFLHVHVCFHTSNDCNRIETRNA